MGSKAREIFISNLKYWMKKRNKEQADIARDLKINISTVSSWYNGIAYPRVDKMQMLADYLNIPMAYLTDELSEETKKAYPNDFETAQDALLWLADLPVLEFYGGDKIQKMTPDEQREFASDVLDYMAYLSNRPKR